MCLNARETSKKWTNLHLKQKIFFSFFYFPIFFILFYFSYWIIINFMPRMPVSLVTWCVSSLNIIINIIIISNGRCLMLSLEWCLFKFYYLLFFLLCIHSLTHSLSPTSIPSIKRYLFFTQIIFISVQIFYRKLCVCVCLMRHFITNLFYSAT